MWRTWWRRLSALLAAIANWRFFKPAVFLACLIPGVVLAYNLCQILVWNHPEALGVDPKKTLLHETGEDALGFLVASLMVTPVRRIFKINRVQAVRRLLGVTAFFYALGHVSTYLVFDQLCYSFATCDYSSIWTDILKRKFIFAGMTAFTILTMLAITSTSGWVRRLKKRWVTSAPTRLCCRDGRRRPLRVGTEIRYQRAIEVGGVRRGAPWHPCLFCLAKAAAAAEVPAV